MEKTPALDYSYCWSVTFLQPGDKVPPGTRKDDLGVEKFRMIMEALLVRTTVFEQVGLFDESLETSQDSDWLLRAKDAGLKMGVLEEVLVRRRLHASNNTYQPERQACENQNLLRLLHDSVKRQRSIKG